MDGLFNDQTDPNLSQQHISPGASILRNRIAPDSDAIMAELSAILAQAPFRHMTTPGGLKMSVAMTNCGTAGWVSDRKGYRYSPHDPDSGRPWPRMPKVFQTLATQAAAKCGFTGFVPDVCLINRYEPGARLTPHQDKDERDFEAPIVSFSLGLSAVFLFGGLKRTERPIKMMLDHGDCVVWGGPARLAFHGIMPLKEGVHPILGRQRLNLTFRKAL